MSSINSVGGNLPVQNISTPAISKAAAPAPTAPARAADRVELSGVSHLLSSLKTNDVRADKVASIKAQIEAGTYETDDKLDAAADKMLDDVLET
ncbi:MAG: flagellar biosynthesis anti-sigma factor FlgM [Phycisphaerae bacterium]|nr:flagellar biosynthesis anti-sigma factor FlgM [Phycisphaerae bacterium]